MVVIVVVVVVVVVIVIVIVVAVVVVVVVVSQAAPKGYGSLADQLRRAALSVPLNVAKGAGQPTGKDSARYVGIARGSAMECGAILDAFPAIGAGNATDIADGRALVVRIVEMLTKMYR